MRRKWATNSLQCTSGCWMSPRMRRISSGWKRWWTRSRSCNPLSHSLKAGRDSAFKIYNPFNGLYPCKGFYRVPFKGGRDGDYIAPLNGIKSCYIYIYINDRQDYYYCIGVVIIIILMIFISLEYSMFSTLYIRNNKNPDDHLYIVFVTFLNFKRVCLCPFLSVRGQW